MGSKGNKAAQRAVRILRTAAGLGFDSLSQGHFLSYASFWFSSLSFPLSGYEVTDTNSVSFFRRGRNGGMETNELVEWEARSTPPSHVAKLSPDTK